MPNKFKSKSYKPVAPLETSKKLKAKARVRKAMFKKRALIITLGKKGTSIDEIAATVNLSHDTVEQVLLNDGHCRKVIYKELYK